MTGGIGRHYRQVKHLVHAKCSCDLITEPWFCCCCRIKPPKTSAHFSWSCSPAFFNSSICFPHYHCFWWLLEGNSLRFLVQISIIKQSLHRKKKMFLGYSHAATWNSNLLYQQHTGFPEHFSHSPWMWADLRSAQDFTVCSVSFPASSGILGRRLLHHSHSHSLESYSVANRVDAVASYEMLFQPSWKAGSPPCRVGGRAWIPWKVRDSDQPIYVLVWRLIYVFQWIPQSLRKGEKRIHRLLDLCI